jgi:hypothetical protein
LVFSLLPRCQGLAGSQKSNRGLEWNDQVLINHCEKAGGMVGFVVTVNRCLLDQSIQPSLAGTAHSCRTLSLSPRVVPGVP